MIRKWSGLALAGVMSLSATYVASAQHYVMMPDSTNNRTVLFDPNDGSLVNSNYFGLPGGTSVHALQVDDEIWVSTQIGDRIDRYDLTGTPISSITGGMDNLRGMALIGGKVFVCNDGTGNGAPGAAILAFDTSGNPLGSFNTPSSSPFGILEYGNNMLVSSDAANDDVHQYTLGGASVGTFHNSTSLNFAEQMDYDSAGNILVAAFSSNQVVTLNNSTGAIVSTFAASGARGVYQLGNGNILWTNSGGAHVYNVGSGTSSQVYAGGGRFLDDLVIPTPGALAVLGLGGLVGFRRRRS